jgi:cytochrome c oxidase subunit 4
MSETHAKTDPEVAAAVDETVTEALEPHERHHPSDGTYVMVALFLAILTALEVATYYVDLGRLLVPVLIVMMVVKFAVVAAWFMHLRFDSTLFRRVFVAGILLAVSVYVAALATFRFFE